MGELNCTNEQIKLWCGEEKDGNGIYVNNDGTKMTRFECSRICNINKLRNMYKSELDNYYNSYNNFLSAKFNQGEPDKQKLAATLETDIISHKENLSNILDSLKQNIEKTDVQINSYNQDIISTNDNISDRNQEITNQYETLKQRQDELEGKYRMIDTGIERNHYKRNVILFLIFINILIISTLASLILLK